MVAFAPLRKSLGLTARYHLGGNHRNSLLLGKCPCMTRMQYWTTCLKRLIYKFHLAKFDSIGSRRPVLAVHGLSVNLRNQATTLLTFASHWRFLEMIVSLMSAWQKPMAYICLCLCGGRTLPGTLGFSFGRRNRPSFKVLKVCNQFWLEWCGPSTRLTTTSFREAATAFVSVRLAVIGHGTGSFGKLSATGIVTVLAFTVMCRKIWTCSLLTSKGHHLDDKHEVRERACWQWPCQACEPLYLASQFWHLPDSTLPAAQPQLGLALDVKWGWRGNSCRIGLLGRSKPKLGTYCGECLGWFSGLCETAATAMLAVQVHCQDDFQKWPWSVLHCKRFQLSSDRRLVSRLLWTTLETKLWWIENVWAVATATSRKVTQGPCWWTVATTVPGFAARLEFI